MDKTLQVSRTKKAPEPILNDAPTARIELQTKITASKRLTDTGIVCALGKSERCSLNFTGAPSIGAESWHWDFGDGITADKKNPGSHAFPLGKYQVRLLVTRGAMRHTALYDVEVVKDFVQQKECPDCASFPGKLQISATLPNPPHADTVEWIEITNISPVAIPLGACQMHTRTRSFSLSGTIEPNQTLRLRQAMTGLILGNENESLSLTCGEVSVDAFAWNFPVPTGYIIRREVLFGIPEQTIITAVIDGDTVEAIIGGRKTRIRLLGIDTPETVHPTKPVEKFGKEASDFARRRLEGKPVWVTFDAVPVDHYGRRLGYIWECGGSFSEVSCTLFNAEVVMLGYGRMERRFPFYRYAAFDAFEKQAKNAKIGIWSDPDFVQDLDVLSQEEREMLTLEQEMEYLKLQEELLEACAETEAE